MSYFAENTICSAKFGRRVGRMILSYKLNNSAFYANTISTIFTGLSWGCFFTSFIMEKNSCPQIAYTFHAVGTASGLSADYIDGCYSQSPLVSFLF